jgi:3'-phosphoadenosine 5'-phosphosulfate sulfotransferase (PAPS reductase)/FAD synthetase
MDDPFHITGPALISFSGGRTSGYMLWRILQAHGGTLPDDVHVCFANTGKEREETLRFVHECATRWGVRVRWLEWRALATGVEHADRFEEVGFNSAARDGEPFEALIGATGTLPGPMKRFCSGQLKQRTLENFMRANGLFAYTNAIGLRADEPGRVARNATQIGANTKVRVVAPLFDAGITNRDVRTFWREQDFDLQLLPFEGNCDGCFLKARPKLFEIERMRPGTLEWWSEWERRKGERFSPNYTYSEVQEATRNQGDLFMGAFDNDPDMDAECGTWCGEAA